MKWGILKNEFDDNHLYWLNACKKYNQNYEVIDLISNNWLDSIKNNNFIGFLTCPPGRETLFKQLYDERIFIIEKVLNHFCYPSYGEIQIYENKKYLSYWLSANGIPHPRTNVFYSLPEALDFINKQTLPIVAKFNIGASGKGVEIFNEKNKLKKYVQTAFRNGIKQDWGPNLKMGNWTNRIIKIINKPSHIKKRLKVYNKVFNEVQKGFIILQDYIPHDFEWRIVKIGDSYFGHKKVKTGQMASGTKGINYVLPSDSQMNFVKDLCDRFNFNAMAVDCFEDEKGNLLVNELQTIFGHVQEYICEKNGVPGRIVYKEKKWIFEEGMFNQNLSYDLRLKHAISLIKQKEEI